MLGGRARPHQAIMALALDIVEDVVVECWLLFSSSLSHRGSAESGCWSIIEDVVGCWAAVLALVESPWLCLWLLVDHRGRGGMLGCRPRPRRVAVALPLAVGRSLSWWDAGLPSLSSLSRRGLGSGCQLPSSGLGGALAAVLMVLVLVLVVAVAVASGCRSSWLTVIHHDLHASCYHHGI